MAKPEFKVGDLVTRGRGRVTYRVVAIAGQPGYDVYYGTNDIKDKRKKPRIAWHAESNLRLVEEAK
jgi:hypothetical protein